MKHPVCQTWWCDAALWR